MISQILVKQAWSGIDEVRIETGISDRRIIQDIEDTRPPTINFPKAESDPLPDIFPVAPNAYLYPTRCFCGCHEVFLGTNHATRRDLLVDDKECVLDLHFILARDFAFFFDRIAIFVV